MSGNEIRDRIKGYFNSVGVNTVVTKKKLNAADEETEVEEEIVKLIFEIRLDRLVEAPKTSNMIVSKGTSKSEITLEINAVASNPPMSGQW
jgi:argonaute-like protein implicated in RNA metabolism and viral defense